MKPPKRILEHAKSIAHYGPGFGNIKSYEQELQRHREEILKDISHYKKRRKELEELRSEQLEMIEWLRSIGEKVESFEEKV